MDYKKLSRVADSAKVQDSVVEYTSDIDKYFEGRAGKTEDVFPGGVEEDIESDFGPVKPWCFTFEGNADFDVKFFDSEEEMNEFVKNHYDKPYPVEDSAKKVGDSNEVTEGWEEVHAGINETPCGLVNKEHTKFKPYVGSYMDGYDFEDLYGDWPFAGSRKAKAGIKKVAEMWGVDPSEVKTGANDAWEGGYLYVERKDVGDEVDIEPEEVEEVDGTLFFSYGDTDAVDDVYRRLPKGDYWWWPSVNDQ